MQSCIVTNKFHPLTLYRAKSIVYIVHSILSYTLHTQNKAKKVHTNTVRGSNYTIRAVCKIYFHIIDD